MNRPTDPEILSRLEVIQKYFNKMLEYLETAIEKYRAESKVSDDMLSQVFLKVTEAIYNGLKVVGEDAYKIDIYINRYLLEYWEIDVETGKGEFNVGRFEEEQKIRRDLIIMKLIDTTSISEEEVNRLIKKMECGSTFENMVKQKLLRYFSLFCAIYTAD